MKKIINKKRSSKKSVDDLFYLSFIGEMVQITSVVEREAGNAMAIVDGYLLDITDEFYLLGPSADEVTMAVKREPVVLIETIQKKDPALQILENHMVPKDPNARN